MHFKPGLCFYFHEYQVTIVLEFDFIKLSQHNICIYQRGMLTCI